MFEFNFDHEWIEFNCPHCSYINEIQLLDAKCEKTVFCPNCKFSIKLIDSEASVHTSIESTKKAIKEFEKALKNLGK